VIIVRETGVIMNVLVAAIARENMRGRFDPNERNRRSIIAG
jgi:hypothetical protein